MLFRSRRYRLVTRHFSRDAMPLWLFVGTVIAIGAVIVIIVVRGNAVTEDGYERYRWEDTKYSGIRSRVVTRNTPTSRTTIEYPVTANQKINDTVAAVLDHYDHTFDEYASKHPTGFQQPYEQNSSFQVVRLTPKYLSILVATSRELHVDAPVRETAYWTFDRATGHAVGLPELFENESTNGVARVNLYVKQAIHQQLAKQQAAPDMSRANSLLTNSYYKSFLTPSPVTLRFDFAPGEVAEPHMGTISVTLSVDNLQLFMQNDTARGLFDVLPIGMSRPSHPQQLTGSPDCQRLKCIALTFDDGPSSYTNGLLDTLESYNAHASFFLIGQNISRYPATVTREHTEGHTVGNHSWDHPWLTRISQEQVTRELSLTNNAVKSLTGITPTYMRPPNGAVNRSVYTALERLNMTGVLWSVDTRDWADRNSDIIYSRVVAGAKPGSIIILHDVHKTSVAAVPRIIKTLQKEGYAFVSLDEMFGPNAAPGKIISRAQ